MLNTRSIETITEADLKRLTEIARQSRAEFFVRNPNYEALKNQVMCVALCQGAALHYLDKTNGVKDFDLWTFYYQTRGVEFPVRWREERDFGDAKFGQTSDKPHFIGRRVDLLGRSLPVLSGLDPVWALRRYLNEAKTSSAKHLAQKAVILLEPTELFRKVIWPIT